MGKQGNGKDPAGSQLADFIDDQSSEFLHSMSVFEKVRGNRVAGVRTVLVVLSADGLVYDRDSLRQKILLAYPDAAVFFTTALGVPVGPSAPQHVDLVIDLSGPGQRQPFFFGKKLRSRARVAVGRNAGFFRKRLYDRVFDEVSVREIPDDVLSRERVAQKAVLELAGVALAPMGDVTLDRSKSIARELPPMQRL